MNEKTPLKPKPKFPNKINEEKATEKKSENPDNTEQVSKELEKHVGIIREKAQERIEHIDQDVGISDLKENYKDTIEEKNQKTESDLAEEVFVLRKEESNNFEKEESNKEINETNSREYENKQEEIKNTKDTHNNASVDDSLAEDNEKDSENTEKKKYNEDKKKYEEGYGIKNWPPKDIKAIESLNKTIQEMGMGRSSSMDVLDQKKDPVGESYKEIKERVKNKNIREGVKYRSEKEEYREKSKEKWKKRERTMDDFFKKTSERIKNTNMKGREVFLSTPQMLLDSPSKAGRLVGRLGMWGAANAGKIALAGGLAYGAFWLAKTFLAPYLWFRWVFKPEWDKANPKKGKK